MDHERAANICWQRFTAYRANSSADQPRPTVPRLLLIASELKRPQGTLVRADFAAGRLKREGWDVSLLKARQLNSGLLRKLSNLAARHEVLHVFLASFHDVFSLALFYRNSSTSLVFKTFCCNCHKSFCFFSTHV